MRILVLSCNNFPYPPSRGGTEVRTFNLIKYLHQNHDVTLFARRVENVTETQIEELKTFTDDLVLFPPREIPDQGKGLTKLIGQTGRFLEAIGQMTPANVLSYRSPLIQERVDEYVEQQKCDVIICAHSISEIFIRPEYRQRVKTVVDIHSSVYGWTRNHLDRGASAYPLRDFLYLPLLYQYEKRYCAKFSQLVATTDYDREQLLKILPDIRVEIVPNGVDLDLFPYRPRDPGGHNLVFVGAMSSTHNIDAARFFVLEVLPVIQQRYPDTTLTLVGANPAPEVLELANYPGVSVTGTVPSTVEYLHRGTIAVVPLRVGLGIKCKTLESMAAGIPIVASDRGLEGLTVAAAGIPPRALRANSVAEYVTAIARLFDDPSVREQLSHNGRAMVESEYTWERAGQRYEEILRD